MSGILTIDIAHPAMRPEDAERELDIALRKVESSADTCVLKIIHGYGSGGKGGVLKTVVQNWAYRRKNRFRSITEGHQLDPFAKPIQTMMQECNLTVRDIGVANEGVTLIWVK